MLTEFTVLERTLIYLVLWGIVMIVLVILARAQDGKDKK